MDQLRQTAKATTMLATSCALAMTISMIQSLACTPLVYLRNFWVIVVVTYTAQTGMIGCPVWDKDKNADNPRSAKAYRSEHMSLESACHAFSMHAMHP